MNRLLAGLLVATAAITGPEAYAQDADAPATQAEAPAAPISEESLALARQVVELSGTSSTFDELLPNIAEDAKQQFVRANPQMQLGIIAVVDNVARELVARRPDLDNDLARIWAAAFNDTELQAFIEFYSSEPGKKLADFQNRLLAVEMAAAQKWSRAVARELADKVQAQLRATIAAEGDSLTGADAPAAPAQ